MNAGDIRWSLPRVIWHLEDLRLGMSYPNYYIARLASKFVKVCLSGAGGDELFGGYPWRYYRVFRSLDRDNYLENYYGFWQRLPMRRRKALFRSGADDEGEMFDVFRSVYRMPRASPSTAPRIISRPRSISSAGPSCRDCCWSGTSWPWLAGWRSASPSSTMRSSTSP